MPEIRLSAEDKELLQEGYEKYLDTLSSNDCTLTHGYAIFGTFGMALCQYKNRQWYRKIVNDWRDKSFSQLLTELDQLEWEAI